MEPVAFVHDLARTDFKLEHLRDVYGGKAASLVVMIAAGYGDLVPQGFAIPCSQCHRFIESKAVDPELCSQVEAAIRELESRTGKTFGRGPDPLLLSVRSGAKESMPGLMSTVLNLGSTGEGYQALSEQVSPEFARATVYQFLKGLSEIAVTQRARVSDDTRREPTDLHDGDVIDLATQLHKRLAQTVDLDDLDGLLWRCIEGVFQSWNSPRARAIREREPKLRRLPGTAVLVQDMRFGHLDEMSGSGIVFSRNPTDGTNNIYVQYGPLEQGDVLVSGQQGGIPLAEFSAIAPDAARVLDEVLPRLEVEYGAPVDVEFTVEEGRLNLLQCRRAVLSGPGTLRAALDMLVENNPDRVHLELADLVALLEPADFERSMYGRLKPSRADKLLAEGQSGGPGAVSGKVIFSPAELLRISKAGGSREPRILVTETTSPDDIPAMEAAAGYVTMAGGPLAHAALMARKWGKPAVVGVDSLRIDRVNDRCEFTSPAGTVTVDGGQEISIDGSTGAIYLERVEVNSATAYEEVGAIAEKLRQYYRAAVHRGAVDIYVNADTPDEVQRGLDFGAAGVGLVRTEAMPRVQVALRSLRGAIRRTEPLSKPDVALLEEAHRSDFVEILERARGRWVSIRFLDDTEWSTGALRGRDVSDLPETLDEIVRGTLGGSEPRDDIEGATTLGPRVRGVRIALLDEQIYALQVRALMAALETLNREDPQVELVIPMVIDPEEVRLVSKIVQSEVAQWRSSSRIPWVARWDGPPLSVMIETPRAAEVAGRIASLVDGISFGTNDLTQMVFGFDREDIGGHVMSRYFSANILQTNPFEVLDQAVQNLLSQAAVAIRDVKECRMTVGGQHASDETSVDFFASIGVHVLSCTPDKVPVALLLLAKRLAKGRAADGAGGPSTADTPSRGSAPSPTA